MVAAVRCATPGTDVVCSHQCACSGISTIQSARTPPPCPPMARMAILMGVSVCGVEGVVMVSRLYRNVFQPRLSACLQMGNDALAHPVEEAVDRKSTRLNSSH